MSTKRERRTIYLDPLMVQKIRKSRGGAQAIYAVQAGITVTDWCLTEKHGYPVGPTTAARMAAALKVDLDLLLRHDGPAPRKDS